MGVADRFYMREPYSPPRYTNILIGVLIVAFVLQSIFLFYGGFDSFHFFGLTVDGLGRGRLWQLLTFQFMHSAPWPWHVLMNCLGLYFFGRSVEETLGSKRFLTLYLLSGVAGGLLQVLATMWLPKHADVPVVGASAGVCGIIAIFCTMYPMRELTTWIYFFPVTIRAHYFLIFLTCLSIFGTIIPFDYVAHAAHLGGILTGIAYVKWFYEEDSAPRFLQWFKRRNRQRELVRTRSQGTISLIRPAASEVDEAPSAEFISKEVDPILDKISAHGINSLTDRERKILEKARAKMSRRAD